MNQTNSTTVNIIYFPSNILVCLRIPLYIIGILTNITNISVFVNPKLKDPSYKVMLIKALTNLLYLSIGLETDILNNCTNCPWTTTYIAAFNYIYMFIFVSSCLHFYTIAIDVFLSVYVYLILINRPCSRKYAYIWTGVLFVATVAFYSQKPLIFSINEVGNTNIFVFKYTSFGSSWTNKTIQLVQNCARFFLGVVVVSVVNFLNLLKFNSRYNSKSHSGLNSNRSGKIYRKKF